jgi:carbamoyltransferase
MGPELWDADTVPGLMADLGAVVVSPEDVADLLADGKIIGTVRGRTEFGPRALGHRSLLAFPFSDMKDRMNRLKVREWFRPVAPVFTYEAREMFVGPEVDTPYMSFAPVLNDQVKESIPAVVHFDSTARPQTVRETDDPWLHRLLVLMGERMGYPVLINTSFNTRGKPILNRVAEALELLQELEDLEYVVVEDWLVSKAQAEAWGRERGPAK